MDEHERQQEKVAELLEGVVNGPHIELTDPALTGLFDALGSAMGELDARDRADRERSGDGWHGRVAGYAPVQGIGVVDGHPWYFRARWDGWSFDVLRPEDASPDGWPELGNPVFVHAERYGDDDDFAASWMPFTDAWRFIERSIEMFRAQRDA
jgi:hypothetical protein